MLEPGCLRPLLHDATNADSQQRCRRPKHGHTERRLYICYARARVTPSVNTWPTPTLALLPLAGLFLIGSRRRVPRGFVLLLALTAGIISISGCGTTAPIKMAPTGSQTVRITATEGAQVQAASIVVSISP